MAQIKVTVIMEEEQVKELFEERDIKFTKKKMKELQTMLDEDSSEVDEAFSDIVDNMIADNYDN